jgi:hypothetical protein
MKNWWQAKYRLIHRFDRQTSLKKKRHFGVKIRQNATELLYATAIKAHLMVNFMIPMTNDNCWRARESQIL